MNLNEKFIPIRDGFYWVIENFFKNIAELFGYPENPGMLTTPNRSYFGSRYNLQFFETLPRHVTFWPQPECPETWFETIFGPTPKLDIVPRYNYESKEEGFYNFYIENYKNIYFLPDWLSEFIQVKLHICLNITTLNLIHETIFLMFVAYYQIIILRITLSWLISINPYTLPWCYVSAAVDWTEEVLQGIIPSVFGVNITASLWLGVIGVIADSLNHLVLTMPFLPSEGETAKVWINGQLKDVLVFHYLPILWYRYPIPNEVREFWYQKRPDILNYMITTYGNLGINFFPNN